MIRLNAKELETIHRVLHANDTNSRVTLFGSRTNMAKRGGDIDLLWEPACKVNQREALRLQYLLELGCDCRVDLLIKQPDSPLLPIHSIAKQGVSL
jgi:predicted nucleotidyltransferase